MAGKQAKVISIDRIVDANLNISEFEHRPSQIRQWFSNNIIRPAFSYLVGWTGVKAVMLKATSTGILKVANVGSGLERVEVTTGIAVAAESGDVVLDDIASRVRIIANTHDMYFRPSRDATNYEDQIHVKADIEQTFDITCAAFRVQRYGLNDVEYEMEGYR